MVSYNLFKDYILLLDAFIYYHTSGNCNIGGVFMAIYNGTHHVIQFKSGEIWDFYAKQNVGISYRRLDKNGIWEKPSVLVSNTQEDFSVKIDNMDHLHLICCSVNGELLYFLYNGMNWNKQTLSRCDPVRYTIRYPMVILIKNKIHILFARGAAFSTGYWSLYHYYWDDIVWHSKEITRLTAGYRLSPFYADLSEKYIHLVYRGLATHQYEIFYCRYHLEHGIWSTPENVTRGTADCNMPFLLIRDDLLHLTWVTLSKTNLIVKYKNKSVRGLGRVEWSHPLQLNSEGSNASFPRLIWVEGKLWCIWYQSDNLIGCSSEKGENWSSPINIAGFEKTSFHNIHYSSNQIREKQLLQVQWILGNVEESLSIPVAGSLMNLPEYRPAPPTAGLETNSSVESERNRETIKESVTETAGEITGEQIGIECIKKTVTSPEKVKEEFSRRRTAYDGSPSLETMLFTEFDRQEEFHYSVITKLEEQSKLDDSASKDIRQALALVKQNNEMLQVLKKDVEQIKQDIQQLKSKGWFQRLFNKEF